MNIFLRSACFFIVISALVTVELPLYGRSDAETASLVDHEAVVPYVLPAYWHDFDESYRSGLIAKNQWFRVADDEVIARFGHYEHMISGVILYRPIEVLNKHPLVFWVVHGTWARGSGEFWNSANAIFGTVIDFAIELAAREKRPIEIVSYGWSSEDSHEARREAGSGLRVISESFYSSACGYGPLWALGHSHGVNVLFVASQETSFDTIISLGAPVLESVYAPLHVGRLYHFYSLNDPVQKVGSFDRRSIRHILLSSSNGRIYTKNHCARAVYNLRALLDGIDPGHLSLKFMVPYLWAIIDQVHAHYQYHFHFNVNVGSDKLPSISIRDKIDLLELLGRMDERALTSDLAEKFRAELLFSKQQEDSFASKYHGRKIGDANRWWQSIFANWIEFGEIIYELVPALRPGIYLNYSLLKETGDT